MGWQWHRRDHMQIICIMLKTDSLLLITQLFYRPDAVPATQPIASKHWRMQAYLENSWYMKVLVVMPRYLMNMYQMLMNNTMHMCQLINEPWAGDIYSQPSILFPGKANGDNLGPLYDHINTAIRSVDEDTLIFYEPVTWSVFLSSQLGGTGFNTVPGGPT